jgi:hypothetical protein
MELGERAARGVDRIEAEAVRRLADGDEEATVSIGASAPLRASIANDDSVLERRSLA